MITSKPIYLIAELRTQGALACLYKSAWPPAWPHHSNWTGQGAESAEKNQQTHYGLCWSDCGSNTVSQSVEIVTKACQDQGEGIWTPPEVRNVKELPNIIRLSYIATKLSNKQFIQIPVTPIYIHTHTHTHVCMYNIPPLFLDVILRCVIICIWLSCSLGFKSGSVPQPAFAFHETRLFEEHRLVIL